ncbi:MAG TPA: exo-beta-N-acetylmuramidase NamZ domain-containing protein [Syntrophales bacterium]|nr:exo-beta-N-acetylmuramidase NamZ domain-containing protein [Syntrophales bacterium]
MSHWKIKTFLLSLLVWFFIIPSASADGNQRPSPVLNEDKLTPITGIVEKAISEGKTPGAVVLVGNAGEVVYRKAFGYSSIEPKKVTMTEDTIFDVASLTKVVATTTAVMQLVENRKLRLDAPVAKYWPAFKKNGKARITIRQLLTHYSGLRPEIRMDPKSRGYKTAMNKIIKERPIHTPGSSFTYSDINFEVLGEIVRRVTGQPLDKYCDKRIFKPLGMKDTAFKPPITLKSRIAATEYRRDKMLCGEVHDPSCYNMGGVAGHAGLFSSIDDLSLFAQMMLNAGSLGKVKILKPGTVDQMTTPQSPPGTNRLRGLGWDIDTPFASNAEEISPVGSYGHLGYTGTALWIDPVTETYIIVLTNRVHPAGGGDVIALRTEIKKAVSDALGTLSNDQILKKRPSLASYFVKERPCMSGSTDTGRLLTGVDVLYKERFSALAGMRIGLVTNHTGIDSEGRRTVDLLYRAPGIKLKAIFSPEHGLDGKADTKIPSSRDRITGLPVYSLYGKSKKPKDRMLKGLDALVFDIQDAGVRFYTYITTMGYMMEAAAKKGIKFYVLDRPNPITASFVQGPVMDRDLKSFTGYFPMPVRHGMTAGELARMFNAEYKIGAKLTVIKMSGYRRTQWYDETGQVWVNPSPNLRSLTEATLYPGVAMAEGANVSVGRGTAEPFEVLGAPWIEAERLSSYLNNRAIPGVQFMPVDFTPESSIFEGRLCRGVRIILTDRQVLDPAFLGVEIVSALYHLYQKDFKLDDTVDIIGAWWVLAAIKRGEDPRTIALNWQKPLDRFLERRAKYLLY